MQILQPIVIIVLNVIFSMYFVMKWLEQHHVIWLVLAVIQIILVIFACVILYYLLQKNKSNQPKFIVQKYQQTILIVGIISVLSNLFPILLYGLIAMVDEVTTMPIIFGHG